MVHSSYAHLKIFTESLQKSQNKVYFKGKRKNDNCKLKSKMQLKLIKKIIFNLK